jgi:hypothetical protein
MPFEPTTMDRKGLFVAAHFGVFVLQPEGLGNDTVNGGAGGGYLAWMLSPRLSVGYDAFGAVHLGLGDTVLSTFLDSIAVQYWIAPRVWIRGGSGAGRQNTAFQSLELGLFGAIGFDAYNRGPFALDVQLRTSLLILDEPGILPLASLTIGANWH